MAGKPPLLSIVLPCRNQGEHIEQVLEGWLPVLSSIKRAFEIIAVPNACTDSTPEAVRKVAFRHSEVRVVENPKGGWGLSVLAGLREARGDILCYANSARTDPSVMSPLLDLYFSNAPCLAKVWRVERGVPLREAGSLLYNLEARMLFGLKGGDVNGTPKIFPRSLFENVSLQSGGDLLDLELMALVSRMGVPVVEHRVPGFSRHGGKSSTTIMSAVRMYWGAIALWRSLTNPGRPGVPGRA